MGEPAFMKQQIEKKINEGFSWKLKIGAIDFEKELELCDLLGANFWWKSNRN
jgi:hypothetical protein